VRTVSTIILIVLIGINYACDIENPTPDPVENPEYANWIIPKNEIMKRGATNDFIQSIDDPKFEPVLSNTDLSPDDLILGISIKGEYKAYPISILNYHEVINDVFAAGEFMISFCPLSGNSTVWDRNIQGFTPEFGISKFIYNSNHLLYDRISNGHWLPLKFKCVNGELEGYKIEGYNVVETTWANWSEMFPGSKVLSRPLAASFNYSIDPYSSYKNSDTIYFSTNPLNSKLSPKEKVHGIIVDKRLKTFKYEAFGDSTTIINDNFQGLSIVLIGDRSKQYIVSFERRIPGGPELDFFPSNDAPNIIMSDNEGNKYDIFGLAVDGPRKGQALNPTKSISGYWFAIAAMYPDPIIY